MNSFIHKFIYKVTLMNILYTSMGMPFRDELCQLNLHADCSKDITNCKTHSRFQYTVLENYTKYILFISVLFYQRHCDGKPTLDDLPEDCLRCIFRKLSNHSDIIHTGQTNQTNHTVSSHMLLWKQLCFFHFTDQQLLVFLPQELDINEDRVNWRYIYRRCYKYAVYILMIYIISHNSLQCFLFHVSSILTWIAMIIYQFIQSLSKLFFAVRYTLSFGRKTSFHL